MIFENSSTVTIYSFYDGHSVDGAVCYRLQMVDLDGSHAYSDIAVVCSKQVKSICIFPNEAHDKLSITLNESDNTTRIVRLVNQNRQVLQQQKMNTELSSTLSLPVHNYPQGIYFLQISKANGKKAETSKVVIAP